jgi:ubiquinone/menaquinone biosynthesis C-methylase UbiE
LRVIDAVNRYSLSFGNKRAEEIGKQILPLLEGSGRVLDVGCGSAHLGFLISQSTNRQVEFLDVKRVPFVHPEVKVTLYDGKIIPYENRSFETSLAIFTLHHTQNAVQVLKEIVRVTSRYVVIVEDYLKSRNIINLSSVVLKDLIANGFYTNITFQYKTIPEWQDVFTDLNLGIQKEVSFSSSSLLNLHHVGWLLEC